MNYIVRGGWSLQKTAVTLLTISVIFLLSYTYSQNDYLFSDEVRWADLSYSTDGESWSEQVPTDSLFWIRGKLLVTDSTNDYDGVYIGLTGQYTVYWDSVEVGSNGSKDQAATISYYQPLDNEQLSLGPHVIELLVKPYRWIHKDRLYAGVILGNIRKFTIEPLIQFACVAVFIGLLLVIWASLYSRVWSDSVLWLIGSIILYLVLNFSKSIYNYPAAYHDFRLVIYGFSNVLLSLALIYYSLGQIGFKKYRWLLIPASLLLTSIFFFANSYDHAKWYILISAQVISLTVLLTDMTRIKISFLFVMHLYMVIIIQFESGLLMVVGYAMLALIEYVESLLPQPVEIQVKEPPQHLIATFGGDKKVVLLSEIVAIKGANNYTELILMNQERYLCDQSMKEIMEVVPNHYLRVHKSYIVDLKKIDTIHTNRAGGKILTMKNQIQLPVGRAYKHDLIDRLNHQL